ncbi:hypothetical protein IWW54_004251 [Coemansia sp. RSA 2705]|nr:hypothetical protein IWW54_004251 [Coemansia sp. RSA 2705]
MSGGFFRGTTIDQDQRFGDGSKQMMKQATFSRLLKKPVDMKRVNMEAIKPWISDKIFELLEIEDDVLFEYVVNLLEESDKPDPRAMQVNLTGFLEQKAPEFMHSLWTVLLEAQKGEGGIPESFIRKKMEELKRKREDEERAAERIRESSSRGREQSTEPVGHTLRRPNIKKPELQRFAR